jgi:hypothetical protein
MTGAEGKIDLRDDTKAARNNRSMRTVAFSYLPDDGIMMQDLVVRMMLVFCQLGG